MWLVYHDLSLSPFLDRNNLVLRLVTPVVSHSMPHLRRRAVLRPGLPPVVEPGGGDVSVAEPLLHLGNVGLVVERVGGGRGT